MLTTNTPATKYPAFLISPEDLERSITCVIEDTHDAMIAMLADAHNKVQDRKARRASAKSWLCNDGIA
jgi:hypothetical protein